jgi:hypothetical protein
MLLHVLPLAFRLDAGDADKLELFTPRHKTIGILCKKIFHNSGVRSSLFLFTYVKKYWEMLQKSQENKSKEKLPEFSIFYMILIRII